MSARLHVVISNRTEVLVDALCETLAEPSESFHPVDRELVVVQGRGMAVWLNLELCRRFGISANVDFLFPKNLVAWAMDALGPITSDPPYSRERLFWTILAKLPGLLEEKEFAQLARYLGEDANGQRRLQLADRIAATFDEYLTYRPELLGRWLATSRSRQKAQVAPQLSLFGSATADATERWQARLWQVLRGAIGDAHPALRESRWKTEGTPRQETERPPRRVRLFGLSSLPPLFLRVLLRLAERDRVDLYLLNVNSSHTAAGRNALFASCGTVEREFRDLLEGTCGEFGATLDLEPRFEAAPGTTLLEQLQRELLGHGEAEQLVVEETDASLVFHSCHGPIREVEVLHDQLLDLIHEGGVQPHEIVVMAPNIDDYAPLIESVFGRSPQDATYIPHRISDRRVHLESEIALGLASIVAMVRSRVSSADVLDLLTRERVRARFALAQDDLETIRQWVTESGARWGIDAEHRASFDVPKDHANTWRFALDRLLLGYSIATFGEELSLGVLPYDEVEGKAGEVLGRFVSYVETLFEQLAELRRPRSVAEWQLTFARCLAALFASDDATAWQHQLILTASSNLEKQAAEAGYTEPLELEAMWRLLEAEIDQQRPARGFASGGVTFCAMTPMRSIPFRVVWLLGMNESAFPRQTFRPDFNLLDNGSDGRRPGDPDRRLDDRYLFLECLLSARERFAVSFVGQSIRNNSKVVPSVVVSELLDGVLDRAVGSKGRAFERRDLVLEHPLQPFSPRYYQPQSMQSQRLPLFSYERSYLIGAGLLAGERRPTTPLFDVELPPLEDPLVQLGDLAAFFAAPVEALLRRRLGVDLREVMADVPEREPSVLDGLELYSVGSALLQHALGGIPKETSLELVRARGILPTGASGVFEFHRALVSAKPIAALARQTSSIRLHDHFAVDVALADGTRIVGDLGPVFARGLLRAQFARVSAKHLLDLWIRHLVLCAVRPRGVSTTSTLLGRAEGQGVKHLTLYTVEAPLPLLESLVRRYRDGQVRPLPFFPAASLDFVLRERKLQRGLLGKLGSFREELKHSAALQRVYGPDAQLTSQGPDTLLASGGMPASGPGFAELARELFGPVLEHLREQMA